MKQATHQTLNVALSLLLGSAILYWMYRDFDFQLIKNVVLHEMDWTWMWPVSYTHLDVYKRQG